MANLNGPRKLNFRGFRSRLTAAIITSFAISAQGSIVEVPLNTVLKPASDLMTESGQPLSFAEIITKAKNGEDLSISNPVVNIFWQGQTLSAIDEESEVLRKQIDVTGGVRFKAHIGGTRELGLYSIFVEDKTDKKHLTFEPRYQLTFGTSVHTSMLRSALLRKLGFFQKSPVFFREIQLDFESAEQKKEFKETAFCRKIEGSEDELISDRCIAIDPELGPDNPRTEPMIVEMPGTNSLKIRSAYIERFAPKIPSLFNGVTPASINNVEVFGTHRGFRSILVPFAVADLEEGLERVETETFHLVDGKGFLKLNFGSDFRNTDYYDIKWMLRKMTTLTKANWDEIIDAGLYPDQCLKQMAYNGLVSRLISTVNWVNYGAKENQKLSVLPEVRSGLNFTYTCANARNEEIVKDGRLVKDFISGSPIRFSHGLRPSPWGKGDPRRLAIILMQSGLLKKGLKKFSENLHKKKLTVSATDKVVLTPNGPQQLVQAKETDVGFDVDGGRSINTGTLLGSNAPVQMVDTLAISASAAIMKQKLLDADAVTGAALVRSFGARAAAVREFTYVKPIGSMAQAQKTNILDVLKTPSKLEKLGEALDKGGVSEFLRSMQPNEVFIITDSISLDGTAGITQALDAMKMFGRMTNPTISIGANVRGAVVGQTIVSRTDEGLQVVVRDLDPRKNRRISVSGYVSVSAFVNLLSIEKKVERLWYETEVYPITYNPTLMATLCDKFFVGFAGFPETADEIDCTGKLDPDEITPAARREKLLADAKSMKKFEATLLPALKKLIYDTNLDLFREPRGELQKRMVQIKNKVKTTSNIVKAFWQREVMVHEDQVIGIFDPILADGSKNKGKAIQIAVSTRASLRGQDTVGFGLNFFEALIKETGFFSIFSLNPSGMPKGSAEWRVAETQNEITSHGAGENGKLPGMATLKYIWGGWDIKQSDFNQIIEQVNARSPVEELAPVLAAHKEEHGFELIPDGVFNRVEKIDFYRLSINLKIEAEGLNQIAKLVFDPDMPTPAVNAAPQEKMKWFERLSKRMRRANSKLNQAITGDYRKQDALIYNNIIELYGREQYLAECLIEKNQKSDFQAISGEEMIAGTTYPCLADWLNRLLQVSRKFDANQVEKSTSAITEVIYILDEKLPIRVLLNLIGKKNYSYGVNVLGFRAKDQNADQSNWVGPVFGEPDTVDKYRDGLIGYLSEKSKVSPLFLNATQTGL